MSKNKELQILVKKIMAKKALAPLNVSLSWPSFDHREVLQALDSLLNLRISQGPKVKDFENKFAKYIGARYATAANSGSSANLLALSALIEAGDIKAGDEVIIPAATFATVASPILQLGLIPVYVDVNASSWNIDPIEIEKAISKKTRLIMPVHSLGNPADMPSIMKIAKKNKLLVLEDCCEAHGAMVGGKKAGSFGNISTFSFFVAHNMTTGEGGMVLTNNKKYHDILFGLREFGRLPNDIIQNKRFSYNDPVMGNYDARYIFRHLGYNLRMTDIAASLGLEQLAKLDGLNKKRINIVGQYGKFLSKYSKYLILPTVRKNTLHSFYTYQFVVRPNDKFKRQDLVEHLESRKIETRPFFGGCLPDQPAFRNKPKKVIGKLPNSRWLMQNAIFIGCHPALNNSHIKIVKLAFSGFFSNIKINEAQL